MCRLLVGRHLSRTTREIAQTDAAQVNYLKDEADAHQSVRFFNAHEGRLGGWTTLVGRRVQKEAARARTTAYLRCIQQFSVGAISVITIAVGVTRVSAGELSLGAMFALVGLTFAMFSRVTMLTERLSSFDLLGVHWRRFRELAHSDQPTPAGFVAVRPGTPTKGSGVYLNRLKVDLGGRTILNLEPVACAVGKLTVVTGRSGEGKTTLIRALAGIVPTVTADVELVFDWPSDAVRHGVLSVREWSSQCSACFQGDALFENVSIAQNIACYDPIVDAVRVAFAARLACIATEIETVLGGYDGPVVARIMSQGQAQRLLLARALYRTPKVLLLDEATSALDEAMERQVIENVMKTGCTVIAVAHRKQWIRAAHQVYDLSNGMLHSVHPTPESIDAALYP
jgi:ATP-binding cassette subfamily B protein RaxB